MTLHSSTHHPAMVEPSSTAPRSRQAKPIKSHALLAAGLRRLRTLSGVSQHRSCVEYEQPPVQFLPNSLSDSKEAWSSPVPISKRQPIESCDSQPLPPLSQLHGIYYAPSGSQDPNLETESRTSRSHSVRSGQSSTPSASENPPHLLDDIDTPGDDRDGAISPPPMTPSDDSSLTTTTDSSSLLSRVLEVINPAGSKLSQLSPRACQAAFPPIDLQSPYAPYAPTSPLSASSARESNSPPQPAPSPSSFNIRMGLRSLPSVSTKSAAKALSLQQRHAQNFQPPNVLATSLNYSSSSNQACSSTGTFQDSTSSALSSLSYEAGSDQCLKQNTLASPSYHQASRGPPKSGGIKDKLGWSAKPKSGQHGRARSESTGPLATIPFPRSSQDENEAPAPAPVERSRNQSESSTSSFRNNLNNIWAVPIQRIRTSSSLSTIIRSIKPGKNTMRRRSPSEVSFEATRPFSVRTESFYEILDASAIPPCDSDLIPKS